LSTQSQPGGPRPPARAAAVRGDNYQYAVAWDYACRALTDPGIASISVEDAGAGHFDDLAVRRSDDHPDEYFQVKSSNSGDVAVTEEWLTTPVTRTGRSPLQHFHRTWATLTATARPFRLTLLTNRGFDHDHPILGGLRDLYDSVIRVDRLRDAGPRTAAGIARDAWVTHLGVDTDELLAFLAAVRWEQSTPESTWRENAKPRMKLAGLRDDDEAVELGIAIIRELVIRGPGPQSTDDLRRAVDQRNLLATSAQLILAVHAIDRPPAPDISNVTIDWVDRFTGEDPWRRHHVSDPNDWTTRFPADLTRARTSLEAYRARRVQVTGAMRLATHFAVGKELADVRRWVLAVDQRGQIWTTDAPPEAGVTATVLAEHTMGADNDLAVGIALTNDVTEDLLDYVKDEVLPVDQVLVLGPDTVPGPTAVPSNAWLTAWTRSARDTIRQAARRADRVHLFMSAPASAALLLGHAWNTVSAPTTVYEFDGRSYFPTFRLT
jgi:diadenosine tetraphosphatase ApaH/serine/threonine PP2A family protein phosphatase